VPPGYQVTSRRASHRDAQACQELAAPRWIQRHSTRFGAAASVSGKTEAGTPIGGSVCAKNQIAVR
jgi:hypothetical protein